MFRVPTAESENSSNGTTASSNMPTAVTAADQESAAAASPSPSPVTAQNMPDTSTMKSEDYGDMKDMDLSENNMPASSLPAPKMSASPSSSSSPSSGSTPRMGKNTARCPKGSRRNKKTGDCDPAPRRSRAKKVNNVNGQITRKKEKTNVGRIRALEHTQDAILAKLMELEGK